MNWTHVLSFALGAGWMLLVLVSTMLVRRANDRPMATVTPIRRHEGEPTQTRTV